MHKKGKCIFPTLFSSVFLAIFVPGCGNAQDDHRLHYAENTVKSIDRVIQTLYDNGQFSGAVLVSVNGKVVYKTAVGYANIEEGILNTCDTKFRIASFTKPFTAMLILQLAEDGIVTLDGRLKDYLPEFAADGGDKITIHQLLTHTAGITGESRIPNLAEIEKQFYSRERLLECIMERSLVFEPGTDREYSNFGYALLALVIERVTGKSYDEVLNEKICKPAGMVNTLSDITAKPIEKRAIGYTYDYFSGFEKASFLDMSFCLGAGQLLSTVEDLYLFDRALYTDRLLSEKSKELFFNHYGWLPARYRFGKGTKRIASNNLEGSINGFQSHTQRIEKDAVFIAALRNVKEAVYENQIVIKWPSAMVSPVLSILYNEQYDMPKRSAAFTIFRTMNESGRMAAEDIYDEIAKRHQDEYYFDDREFDFFEEELRKRFGNRRSDEYKMIRKYPKGDTGTRTVASGPLWHSISIATPFPVPVPGTK